MKYITIGLLALIILTIGCNNSDDAGLAAGDSGVNQGSYSQMLIIGNYLYGLNEHLLTTVDISLSHAPQIVDRQELIFDTESIFHHEGVLYIGSRSRMYIFSIGTDGIPELRSTSEHFLQTDFDFICNSDPIVANDVTAFVTLNSNQTQLLQTCFDRPQTNQLQTFDIQDIDNPRLLNVVHMEDPKGLGLDGQHLFVCDGWNGLIVFDIGDPSHPVMIHHFPSNDVHDVIVQDGLLIVLTKDELLQYDYTNMDDMNLIGVIKLD